MHIFSGHPHSINTWQQWYQQYNYYTQSNHSTHFNHNNNHNCSSTYSTIYKQQVGHQPIAHPPHPNAGSPSGQGTKLHYNSKVPLGKHTSHLRKRHAPDSPPGRHRSSGLKPATYSRKTAPNPSPTLDEQKAIRKLKEDQSRVVLTAEKGVVMIVMNREDYTDKAQLLLADLNTYKPIKRDPTNKLKNQLSQTLRDIKNQEGLNDSHLPESVPHQWGCQKLMFIW